MRLLLSLLPFLLLFLPLQAFQVSAQTQCEWCYRADPESTTKPYRSVCNSCVGFEVQCDSSYEIASTCHSFSYDRVEGIVQATCRQSTDTWIQSNVSLNTLIGVNDDGTIQLGGSIKQTCSWIDIEQPSTSQILDLVFMHILMKGNCRNHRPAEVGIDLNSILINDRGLLTVPVPLRSQPKSQDSLNQWLLQQLPKCPIPKCEVGFKFQDVEATNQCIQCNETDAKPGTFCTGIRSSTLYSPCRVGYYCSGADQPERPCENGCECEEGSTSACPVPCPAGRLCRSQESPVPCPVDHYCPAGLKTDPLPCDRQCLCPEGSQTSCPALCPDGRLCQSTSSIDYCPITQWCSNNTAYVCPAGTYGESFGLSDDSCTSRCGIMWTSRAGSLSCYDLSGAGIFISTILVIASLGLGLTGVYKATLKMQQQEICRNFDNSAGDTNAIEADMRSLIQGQIRTGVDALAKRVIKQAFPSVLTLSASLMQFQIASVEQVQRGIEKAREELTECVKIVLSNHACLRFDDETYPWKRPLFAEVDPTSEDGELSLIAFSNILSSAIRTPLENDLLEWFNRQRQGQQPIREEKEGESKEEEKLLDQDSEEDSSGSSDSSDSSDDDDDDDDVSSRWPSVVVELQSALRTALLEPSKGCISLTCMQDLRVAYARSTSRTLSMRIILQLAFDILVLIACFMGLLGNDLIDIQVPLDEFPNAAALYRNPMQYSLPTFHFNVNWERARRPQAPSTVWWFNRQVPRFSYILGRDELEDVNLFQPVLDECTSSFGTVYYLFLIFTIICFWILAIITFIEFCNSFLQLSHLCRGCSLAIRKRWSNFMEPFQGICYCSHHKFLTKWFHDGEGTLTTIRVFGVLWLILAITVYFSGCILRLNYAPAIAQSNYAMSRGKWDSRAPGPTTRIDYSVELQSAFILSIIAAALAIIPAVLAIQQTCRKLQEADARRRSNRRNEEEKIEAKQKNRQLRRMEEAPKSDDRSSKDEVELEMQPVTAQPVTAQPLSSSHSSSEPCAISEESVTTPGREPESHDQPQSVIEISPSA